MPSSAEIAAVLARLPLFAEVGDENVLDLAARAEPIAVPRSGMVFDRGDIPRGFHVVVGGRIKLALILGNGSEKVVEIIEEGQSFGEAVVFLGRPYPLRASALADSDLILVPREAILRRLEEEPAFALRMLAGMSMRLHRLVNTVTTSARHSATARVAAYLSGLERSNGVVELSATKAVVASRLNLTPESFSRALHTLRKEGVLAVDGGSIRILSPDGLTRHAEEEEG